MISTLKILEGGKKVLLHSADGAGLSHCPRELQTQKSDEAVCMMCFALLCDGVVLMFVFRMMMRDFGRQMI